jgi:hypothetical protein
MSLIYSMRPYLINAEVPLFIGQVVEIVWTKTRRGFRRPGARLKLKQMLNLRKIKT